MIYFFNAQKADWLPVAKVQPIFRLKIGEDANSLLICRKKCCLHLALESANRTPQHGANQHDFEPCSE
jgi:hypothetical protein